MSTSGTRPSTMPLMRIMSALCIFGCWTRRVRLRSEKGSSARIEAGARRKMRLTAPFGILGLQAGEDVNNKDHCRGPLFLLREFGISCPKQYIPNVHLGRSPKDFAGTPPTTLSEATSRLTTAPAAITARSPIVTPPSTVAPAPIHTLSPMTMALPV